MKKDRREEVERIVEYIITHYNYGDTIQHKQLERLIGAEQGELEYAYLLASVKNELITYGCVLTPVVNEGYRILYPNEIAREVYKKYAKSSLARLEKGLMIMSHIDTSTLTQEEKQQFDDIEKIVQKMRISSENSLLEAQFIIGDVKRKELNGGE